MNAHYPAPVFTIEDAMAVHLTESQNRALDNDRDNRLTNFETITEYVQLTMLANEHYARAADNDDNDPERQKGLFLSRLAMRALNSMSTPLQQIASAIYTNCYMNWREARTIVRLMEQQAEREAERNADEIRKQQAAEAVKFNGHKNYATWTAFTFLTNDERTYEMLVSHLKMLDMDAAAVYIRNFVGDNFVISTGHHVTSRLLSQIATAELETIDFYAIAQYLKS